MIILGNGQQLNGEMNCVVGDMSSLGKGPNSQSLRIHSIPPKTTYSGEETGYFKVTCLAKQA